MRQSAGRVFKRFVLTRPRGAGQFIVFGLAALMFVAQRFAVSSLGQHGAEADLRRAIFYSTTAVLIVLALQLRHYVGAWLVAAGIVMNFIPISAHGGLMPVAWETIRDSGEWPEITEADIGEQVTNSKDIVLWRADIRFEPLSDRYLVELPLYGSNIYSLGDFVVFAGVGLAAIQIVYEVARGPARVRADAEEQDRRGSGRPVDGPAAD